MNEPVLTVGILDSRIRRGALSRTARCNSDARPRIQPIEHQPGSSDEQHVQSSQTYVEMNIEGLIDMNRDEIIISAASSGDQLWGRF